MAVNWSVNLEGTKTVGSLSDVVTKIHWSATEGEIVDGEIHSGYLHGCESLAEPVSQSRSSSNFCFNLCDFI